jgi:hypothetical protein
VPIRPDFLVVDTGSQKMTLNHDTDFVVLAFGRIFDKIDELAFIRRN